MGDFKDKHGKTRVGKFLQKLGEKAAPIAEIALNIAGGATGISQLEKVSDLIKGSDHLDEFEKDTAIELLKLDMSELKEVTKRWSLDMNSDSWLSKNIRPMTLAYLLILLSFLAIGDGRKFLEVNESWIDLLQTLLLLAFGAYFGLRSFVDKKKGL